MNQEEPSNPGEFESAPPPRLMRMPATVLTPHITYALIGITVTIYVLQILSVFIIGYAYANVGWLEYFGALFPSAVRMGQYWRLITPVFLHGSIPHIAFNMYALYSIGAFMEQQLGRGRFIALYFLAGFSGNVFSFLFLGSGGFSLGASTALFGVIGAELVFFYQNRKLFGDYARKAISNVIFIVAINLFIGLAPGIDNWGHIGGLLGGAMFAWFSVPVWKPSATPFEIRFEDAREMREVYTGAAVVLLIFGLLALWGM